jgi:hypothetical protein
MGRVASGAMQATQCDVLIVGGGTGGCAAAMAATSLGMKVIMTEPYAWIGGQLTSQAVPPDEHPWIEHFGCTARYRDFRNLVRQRYRTRYLTPEALADRYLNPGGGWVSKLCHEPRVSWECLTEMLGPAIRAGLLQIMLGLAPESAEVRGDEVAAIHLVNRETGERLRIGARYFLDATETGDLLPMTGAEYVRGAESKRETDEPNAVDGDPEPDNIQGLTWCMALGYDPNGDHTIEKPAQYDFWRAFKPDFWPDNLLSFRMLDVRTLEPRDFPLFGNDRFNLFEYRQIVDPEIYAGDKPEAATIANWPQNDYFVGNIIDEPEKEMAERLEGARQLSLSYLYWLQTEAGYPGLKLRPDLTGTLDGLAQAPYIRESRRIRAKFTVLEQHVAAYTNPGRDRAQEFADSVGVGAYRLDLHPSTNGRNTIDTSTLPFQIPLGALIPVRMRNLIPACKNIGVTHLTNGCYRLHPIEWNIGESAGLLAAHCIRRHIEPASVLLNPQDLQDLCVRQGVELEWPRLYAL